MGTDLDNLDTRLVGDYLRRNREFLDQGITHVSLRDNNHLANRAIMADLGFQLPPQVALALISN